MRNENVILCIKGIKYNTQKIPSFHTSSYFFALSISAAIAIVAASWAMPDCCVVASFLSAFVPTNMSQSSNPTKKYCVCMCSIAWLAFSHLKKHYLHRYISFYFIAFQRCGEEEEEEENWARVVAKKCNFLLFLRFSFFIYLFVRQYSLPLDVVQVFL